MIPGMKKIKTIATLLSSILLTTSIVGCSGKINSTSDVEKTVSMAIGSTTEKGMAVANSGYNNEETADPKANTTPENEEIPYNSYENEDSELTPTMRNSINMLNYMTSTTQKKMKERTTSCFWSLPIIPLIICFQTQLILRLRLRS